MPKNAKEFFQLVAFGLVPLAFIWLFGQAIWETFKAVSAAPSFSTGFIVVAGGAAGAMGAGVAIALGVDQGAVGKSGLAGYVRSFGRISWPSSKESWQEFIGWAYLGAYFLLGVLGIVVWIIKSGDGTAANPSLVPELVETLASTVWGLILAVAAKVYNQT